MSLNPFFLNGSSTEQNLIQDLINEQLKIYGVDIMYLPRKIINSDNIFKEIESSRFDDNFIIEAYINNYDGYSGAGDLMTKFGVSLKDEVTLTISKERFEEFIAPILTSIYNPNLIYNDPNEVELVTRPREGDLIYFPLGQRLFEVKFVEHEKPFYQLGKTYVYELQCELFEYEDEVIDTTVDEVDELIKDVTSTLYLIDYDDAQRASVKVAAMTKQQNGYVQRIILNDDGNGYTVPPTVYIEPSPVGLSSANARAVAITTSVGDAHSIKEVLITNAGFGYTIAPIVSFIGGGGSGAAATTLINSSGLIGISSLSVLNPGSGYFSVPTVTISPQPTGIGSTRAVITAIISDKVSGTLTFGIKDAGAGYQYDEGLLVNRPVITVSYPAAMANQNIGVGTFQNGEIIVGSISGSKARVQNWDINTKQLLISTISGSFVPGETIVGAASSATWSIRKYDDFITEDPYAQNDEIENAGIDIIDFSQDNPFGVY